MCLSKINTANYVNTTALKHMVVALRRRRGGIPVSAVNKGKASTVSTTTTTSIRPESARFRPKASSNVSFSAPPRPHVPSKNMKKITTSSFASSTFPTPATSRPSRKGVPVQRQTRRQSTTTLSRSSDRRKMRAQLDEKDDEEKEEDETSSYIPPITRSSNSDDGGGIVTRGRRHRKSSPSPVPHRRPSPVLPHSISVTLAHKANAMVSSYFTASPRSLFPPPEITGHATRDRSHSHLHLQPSPPAVPQQKKITLSGDLEIVVEKGSNHRMPKGTSRVRLKLLDDTYSIAPERTVIHVPNIELVEPILPQKKRKVTEPMDDEAYEVHHRKFELTEKRLIAREREIIRYEEYQAKLKREKMNHRKINKLEPLDSDDEFSDPSFDRKPSVNGDPSVPVVVGVISVKPQLDVDPDQVDEIRRSISQSGFSDRSFRHAVRVRASQQWVDSSADSSAAHSRRGSETPSLFAAVGDSVMQAGGRMLQILRKSTGL